MMPSFLCLVFFVILCSSSTLVRSQEQDSCASNDGVPSNIEFDTSSLQHCVPIWEAHNFILRYGEASSNLWSFVLSFPNSINSYGAMGFSKNGRMVSSSAVAGWTESASGGANNGYQNYYLGGTTQGEVRPGKGDLPLTNYQGYYTDSITYLAFQLQTRKPSPYLIFAVGANGFFPDPSNSYLSKHGDKISIEIDYATGKFKVANLDLKRSHGSLNIGGWSGLMIMGAIIARHCKQWDPIWFYLHASIQAVGFVAGLVGIFCGLALSKKVSTKITHHKNIGILIFVLGFLQVIALKLRPGKESKIRKYWNYYHHNVGRVLIIFAFVNTFYGIHLGEEGSKWFLGYGISIAIFVIVAIILEIRMRMMKSKPPPIPNQIDMSVMHH